MDQLFRFFARFPLWLLHGMGAVVGWLVYGLSSRYRQRWAENRDQAGLSKAQVRGAIAHGGRMIFELPRIWFGKPVPYQWQGVEHVERAYAAGKGVVFLTPHMGCFEITAQAAGALYLADHGPITVLYRPPRQAALAAVVETARRRDGLETAPTTLAGVRQMIKALRRGQAVGLLPDQVPPDGLGVWSPFFGRPAYTMTLAARLVQQTGATPLIAWGERLPRAQGFCIHVLPFPEPLGADLDTAVAQINRAMEGLIRQCPQQYLWGYGRYKTPRSLAA